MKKLLIVGDMQKDFVDGALGTPEAVAIVPHVVKKIEGFDGDIIVTYDTHEENYMQTQEGKHLPVPHCIKGTPGWELDEKVQAALLRAEDKTRNNTGLRLNIALNYGSRAEILRAVRRCAEKAVELGAYPGDEAFENELYSAGQPELDLMIRTSGEERLSNFLLWQAAYAELYFTPIYWPDFTRDEYIQALREFARRGRRFGGL